jgi:FkbM family methyltransferase
MIKESLKRGAQSLGLNLISTERFGVEPELDLARLTANDPLKTIFDVGGNFGQTATRFAVAYPGVAIYTFEPVPSSFEKLQKAIRGHASVKPFNIALGDQAGTGSINLTDSAGSNTLLENQSSHNSVDIKIDTVDAVARAQGVDTIDLLKIDVEGYELQVLKGAEGLLSQGRIRYVFAECVLAPDTESPHTSFFDLHAVLERHGFCFVNYYAESFSLKIGCALGNVLYALKAKLPEKVPGSVLNIS